MEFQFNINRLIQQEISIFNENLPSVTNDRQQSKAQIFEVIDKMGAASAKAQGLRGPITSGYRLMHSDHNLYIMKASEDNNGLGSVIGLLKIGPKNLFVFDKHGAQQETTPLCVLDFYVHESRQRMGCGKKLFEFMLQHEHVRPQHLAIDRPSHKFQSFLAKHYKLKATIPQVNNFVVFDGFFRDRPDNKLNKLQAEDAKHEREYYSDNCSSSILFWNTPQVSSLKHNDSSHRPRSAESRHQPVMNAALRHVNVQHSRSRDSVMSSHSQTNVRVHSAASTRGMMAQNNMYSRHNDSDNTPVVQSTHTANTLKQPQQSSTPPQVTNASTLKTEDQQTNNDNTEELSLKIKDMSVGNARGKNPPLLSREKSNVEPSVKSQVPEVKSKQPWVNPYADPNPAPRTNLGSGWNVFGVPSPSYSRTAPRQQTNNIW